MNCRLWWWFWKLSTTILMKLCASSSNPSPMPLSSLKIWWKGWVIILLTFLCFFVCLCICWHLSFFCSGLFACLWRHAWYMSGCATCIHCAWAVCRALSESWFSEWCGCEKDANSRTQAICIWRWWWSSQGPQFPLSDSCTNLWSSSYWYFSPVIFFPFLVVFFFVRCIPVSCTSCSILILGQNILRPEMYSHLVCIPECRSHSAYLFLSIFSWAILSCFSLIFTGCVKWFFITCNDCDWPFEVVMLVISM